MARRSRGVVAVFVFLALFLAACKPVGESHATGEASAAATPVPGTGARNVIVITIDSLRFDHLGCYGYQRPTSPTLDRFASEGTRFAVAYAPSSWTLPSHASLFTGLYPDTHGVDQERERLDDRAETLAERLKERGYATAAVVCAPFLSKYYNLVGGFDTYDTEMTGAHPLASRRMKVAPDVTAKGLSWIDGHRDEPFFLFLHYWDVHHDYNPPDGYVEMFDPDYEGEEEGLDITLRTDLAPGMNRRDLEHIVALYDGEIRYTDDHLAMLLAGLAERGLNENTMVWITSDHGEEFLDHGQMAHKKTCFEESVRIPMMVKIPWLKTRQPVVEDPVSLVDLFPTILSLLGVDVGDSPVQGVDLSAAIAQGTRLEPRSIMTEVKRGILPGGKSARADWATLLGPDNRKLHAWRTLRLLKKGTPRFRLFDLNTDPGEKIDMARKEPKRARGLKKELRKLKSTHDKLHDVLGTVMDSPEELEPELAETLRGLGYLQ